MNSQGEPCIFVAVKAGNNSVVEALINFGVDPLATANGKSTMDLARELKNESLIQLLSGTPVTIKSSYVTMFRISNRLEPKS